ncbi:MAG: hypothetical protein ACOZHQ_17795 [Thermodesulfobacteriota bacterium]
MDLPALLFPQTAPRRSTLTALAPLLAPVLVLEPAGLGASPPTSPLAAAGLVRTIGAAAEPDQTGERARQADALLRQWEAWAAQNRYSGATELFKAGLRPPQPAAEESFRDIMADLRGQAKAARPGQEPPPQLSGDLFLRLAQLQDQEEAEMEELQAKVDSGQDQLEQALGLDLEDHAGADYAEPLAAKLPPVDYDRSDDALWSRRLAAWTGLAARAEIGPGPVWLATASLPVVSILLERANRRLRLAQPDLRSPAGASAPIIYPTEDMPPDPDSPLAQEALRLVLPDLSRLTDQEFLALCQGLEREGVLGQMRQALANLLARLAAEPWSAGLQAELAGHGRQLADSLAGHVAALGHPLPPARGLSVLAFPGLRREQVIGLMAGADDAGLPQGRDWPQNWPAGSCPLLAAW